MIQFLVKPCHLNTFQFYSLTDGPEEGAVAWQKILWKDMPHTIEKVMILED